MYTEIDMVATPAGDPVAMAHCNNCTGDLDAWVGLFRETLSAFGAKPDMDTLYGTLYREAFNGEADCGGLLAYNYLSGEHVTGFTEGRPLFARTPGAKLSLANFMRVHLYTALGGLRTGMDILLNREHVRLDSVTGHGGFYKVPGVGQRVTAAALNAPVTVMSTAGEGGPWGMALLAAYAKNRRAGETLPEYLSGRVFQNAQGTTVQPIPLTLRDSPRSWRATRRASPSNARRWKRCGKFSNSTRGAGALPCTSGRKEFS